MKKLFFSFVMMIALVIVAGSTMAQGKFAPNPGGTYHYSLPIVIANLSDATLTATGLSVGTSAISNITPSLSNIATSVTKIEFDVTYSNDATGTCRINFTITDKTSSCSNSIYLDVPMNPVPTYTLALLKDVSIYNACQTRTGATNNKPDALGNGTEANTFTFSVTPVVTGVTGDFTYTYTIDFPTGTALNGYKIVDGANNAVTDGVITHAGVSGVVTDVYTVTFNTSTGIDTQTLTSTLSIGNVSTLVPLDGGGTYNATSGGSLTQSVSVNAVPKIGAFN